MARLQLLLVGKLCSPLDFHTARRRSRAFVSTDLDHKSSIERSDFDELLLGPSDAHPPNLSASIPNLIEVCSNDWVQFLHEQIDPSDLRAYEPRRVHLVILGRIGMGTRYRLQSCLFESCKGCLAD